MGVTDHIGYQLTYWILDEQSKQLMARSVVRPLNNNGRVRQDPDLTKEILDENPIDQSFTDGGKKPHIPAEDDTYGGILN